MNVVRKKLNVWLVATVALLFTGLVLAFWGGGSKGSHEAELSPTQRSRPLTEYTLPATTKLDRPSPSQPKARATATPQPLAPTPKPLTSPQPQAQSSPPPPTIKPTPPTQARGMSDLMPKQFKAAVHPTNYGDRFAKDIRGRNVNYPLLVVLHETVGSAMGTINFFQVPHYQDENQASYHALITLDGTIIYLVPPEKRAFGAGNSVFDGPNGPETVQTKPSLPPSVNNFAYHISLETPRDGDHNRPSHSGYTQAQYQSLAWLIARTKVPNSRITTHEAVDRSGERQDPRSFDFDQLFTLLKQYPRSEDIASSGSTLAASIN